MQILKFRPTEALLAVVLVLASSCRHAAKETSLATSDPADYYSFAQAAAASKLAEGFWEFRTALYPQIEYPAYSYMQPHPLTRFTVVYQGSGEISVHFEYRQAANGASGQDIWSTHRANFSMEFETWRPDHLRASYEDVYLDGQQKPSNGQRIAAYQRRLHEMKVWIDLVVALHPQAAYLKTIFNTKTRQIDMLAAVDGFAKQRGLLIYEDPKLNGLGRESALDAISYVHALEGEGAGTSKDVKKLLDVNVAGKGLYRLSQIGFAGLQIDFIARDGRSSWAFRHAFVNTRLVPPYDVACKVGCFTFRKDPVQWTNKNSANFNMAYSILASKVKDVFGSNPDKAEAGPVEDLLKGIGASLADVMPPAEPPVTLEKSEPAPEGVDAELIADDRRGDKAKAESSADAADSGSSDDRTATETDTRAQDLRDANRASGSQGSKGR